MADLYVLAGVFVWLGWCWAESESGSAVLLDT